MYIRFLSAKSSLKIPDGATIFNILAQCLLTQGFIRQEEYDRIKEAYGVNWGNWLDWSNIHSVQTYYSQTGDIALCIKKPNSMFYRRMMSQFLKAMDIPQININLKDDSIRSDSWFFSNMKEYSMLNLNTLEDDYINRNIYSQIIHL